MVTVVNTINVYETKVRGTATSFVRESAVTPNSNDVTSFNAWETAGTSVAGVQTVSFGGNLVGTNDAGLVTATYTASIVLDGTTYPISIPVTTADDVDTIVTAINADLPGTEMALTSGNLVVTSPSTGKASYVAITDTDIFSGMTGYIEIRQDIPGGTEGQLRSNALNNGANGWDAYSPAVEIYDTAADTTVISGDTAAPTPYTAHIAGATTVVSNAATDLDTTTAALATLVTEVTTLTTVVNSLQDLVEALEKRS